MQLIACQYDIQWESPIENYARVTNLLESVEIRPGALIALPEMFSTGYSMNVARVTEQTPSPTEAFLSETAKKFESWTMGGLVYGNPDSKGLNAIAIFDPQGKKIGIYQKNYCFSYADEDLSYVSGNDILLFDWNGFTVCPTICYDLRFPELYRRGVKAGANLFPILANWPTPRIEHWRTLLKARAIENQAIVMGVNRIGQDPKLDFAGASMIIDQHGTVLSEADKHEQCLVREVSLQPLVEWRQTFPALSDIKPG